MQNVACPATTVANPGVTDASFMAESSATPVTTPGRAMGSVRAKVSDSLPGKRPRNIAAAAIVPSTSAIAVAQAATASESPTARKTSSRAKARPNQASVSPGGGNR